MSDDKKDLTGILQFAEKAQASGEVPPPPEGSVLEDLPIEKIDEFESLDDFAKANPVPEPGELPFQTDFPPAENSPTSSDPASSNPVTDYPNFDPSPDHSLNSESMGPSETPIVPELASELSSEGTPPGLSSDFSPEFSPEFSSEPAPPLSQDFNPALSTDFSPDFAPASDPAAAGSSLLPDLAEPSTANSPALSTEPSADLAPAPSAPAPKTPQAPLDKVKKFSESVLPGKPAVQAAFPFSLLVTGFLTPLEQEKLLQIVSQENIGVREIDLEPQLKAGKLLIPRISEYAGIVLAQALHTSSAQIKLGPSDSIFSTAATRNDELSVSEPQDNQMALYSEMTPAAEALPVTTAARLPQDSTPQNSTEMSTAWKTLDTLVASAPLKVSDAEVEKSREYDELLETLIREIKYKAVRKGADALFNLKVQLDRLASPNRYRLLVMGTAVKRAPKPHESAPTP